LHPSANSSPDAAPDVRPYAVVHVDLDGATDIYRAHGWAYPYADDPLFETGMRHALDLFDQQGVRATFFVIASGLDDPRKREWIREAVRRGHDLGSHTVSHRLLVQLSREDKREEISASRQKIEDVIGVPVRGFRAPGCQLDRECLERVAESGYAFDASAIPTKLCAQRLRVPVERLRAPLKPLGDSELLEFPLPDHRPSPFPTHPSYSLLFGLSYLRWFLGRHRKSRTPLVLLCHLTDLAEPLAAERLQPWASRIFTLSVFGSAHKLRFFRKMFDFVRRHYAVVPMGVLLHGFRTAATGVAGCEGLPGAAPAQEWDEA
jgi:hypothetical protein